MASVGLQLAVAVLAALLSAAFSATDTALATLTEARRRALLDQSGVAHLAALRRYHDNIPRMRSTYVVGRVICAALTAVMLAEIVNDVLPGRLDTLVAVLLTVAVVAPLSDLASALAQRRADTLGPRLATYLVPFEFVLFLFAAPLSVISHRFTKRLEPETEPSTLEIHKSLINAEVEFMVDQGEKSGVVAAEPAEMIRNVLGFADLLAKDIMIPRNKVEAIEIKTSLDAVRRLVAESGHSRYPVYEGQLDNVIGILCAKDLFKADYSTSRDAESADESPKTLSDVIRRDAVFIHETQSLASMLREMRLKRHHLAVIVDEFGGTSGIASLEDVLEKIVGDIRDEHDEAEAAPIQDLGDGRLFANPDVSMGDLSAYLGAEIPEDAHDEPLRSVLDDASRGDRAEVGTSIEKYGLQFIVRDVERGAVQRVEVVRPPLPSTP